MTSRASVLSSPKARRLVVLLLLAATALWLATWSRAPNPKAPPSGAPTAPPASASVPASPTPAVEQDAGNAAPFEAVVVTDSEPTAVPPATRPTVEQLLARAKYGDSLEDLGFRRPAPGFDGDAYPPQGFAPLPDGKLLVLDTAKKRLVLFDANGRFERALSLPPEVLLPADVVVAKDGTIVVVDHEGVETAGSVMIDIDGNVKARLPQMAGGMMTDVYTVGNDIYFDYEGPSTSIKAGDTSGSATHETPLVYDQDGIIPGRVAPDGRTAVHVSIHDDDAGQLIVSSITGDPPKHIFSRLYSIGAPIWAIAALQVDAQGIIYVIVHHSRRRSLLCLDGENGEPVGHVWLPRDEGDGQPFSQYVVLESGGMVMQQLELNGSSYHFIDCRPAQ